tara:strand:- start:165 stop:449 length:285 start_codon:yes stop_codon:yes gene_type:complete
MKLATNLSESIVENLLIELDSINYRMRTIEKSHEQINNFNLKRRLKLEHEFLKNRIHEITIISKNISASRNEPLSISKLLLEKTKRVKIENKII